MKEVMSDVDGTKIAIDIVLALLGFALLTLFKRISNDIRELMDIVKVLVPQVAIAHEKATTLEKIQDLHDSRLTRLERHH